MSRADFNPSNNFSEIQSLMDFEGFEDVWKSVDDISTISFELLIPRESIIHNQKSQNLQSELGDNVFKMEELLMRQNLFELAVKENMVVRENFNNAYVNLLVKKDDDIYTDEFEKYLPEMTEDDRMFFECIAKNKNIYLQNMNNLVIEDEQGERVLHKLNFSKNLINLIEYSYGCQRPIRIDFAKDLTVILKIDKQGLITAEFISSDKAMEFLLRSNIPHLKQKLDNSGIKYKKIYYKNKEKESE